MLRLTRQCHAVRVTDPVQSTRVRERTRRSLIAAGVAELSRRPAATMAEIADVAGVSRSTLHRYFADRDALVAAIDAEVDAAYLAAIDAARIDEGSGIDALERLLGEMLDQIEAFAWWMRSPEDDDGDDTEGDRRVVELLHRGQRDGTIDTRLDADWILMSVWSALWAVHQEMSRSSRLRPRELRELCLFTLLKMARA